MTRPASYLILSLLLAACAQNADDARLNDDRPVDADPEAPADTAGASANEAEAPPPTPASNVAQDSVRGTIVVTSMGPSSQATLSAGDGGPIMLAGTLEPELRQLSGAQVDVFGALSGGERRLLSVQRYDIIAIDGERPTVGTVLAGGARLAAGSDTVTVVGQSEPLPTGAKVWIVGRRVGAELRLQSWGVIRR